MPDWQGFDEQQYYNTNGVSSITSLTLERTEVYHLVFKNVKHTTEETMEPYGGTEW